MLIQLPKDVLLIIKPMLNDKSYYHLLLTCKYLRDTYNTTRQNRINKIIAETVNIFDTYYALNYTGYIPITADNKSAIVYYLKTYTTIPIVEALALKISHNGDKLWGSILCTARTEYAIRHYWEQIRVLDFYIWMRLRGFRLLDRC